MQKTSKHLIVLFLIAVFTITSANAITLSDSYQSVQPRYVGVYKVNSDLTITASGRADIRTSLGVSPNYTASVTTTLYSDSGTFIKSWSRSGGGNIEFQESYYVASGHNYYVTLSATIYDQNGKVVDTVIKGSLVVSY